MSEFGLMYYNARWYDPALGRFVQADTLIPQPGNPQSWDRYSYVRNNPTGRIDPTGHMDDDVGGGCESAECRRNARTQFQKRHISNRPQHFILICGVGDGGNCSGEQRLSPYMRFSNTSIYDVDDCGPKSNCANDVFNMIHDHPNTNYYIFSHSAGSDAAILAADKAVNEGLSNILGIVLLDPTLTSSAGNGFPDYSNEGDQTPLVENILLHDIPVFVGDGIGPTSDGVITDKYLDPELNVNLVDYTNKNMYFYYSQDINHAALANDVNIFEMAISFISNRRKP